MKKHFFLVLFFVLVVVLLIFAFQNVFTSSSLSFLFLSVKNSFFLILGTSLLGFLACFFLMMYSFEVRRERDEEQEEEMGVDVGDTIEDSPSDAADTSAQKPVSGDADSFDQDEEELG